MKGRGIVFDDSPQTRSLLSDRESHASLHHNKKSGRDAGGSDFYVDDIPSESKVMAENRIPITREGLEKKKAELEELTRYMLEVTKRVAAARELGDLSENAEYHAAREEQGMVQAKLHKLQDELNRAQIIDLSQMPKDTVVFGCRVTVLDVDDDSEETFELVGPGEDDPDDNKILTTSPIGQGLLGKKVGEIAEIKVPRGIIRFKILEISNPNVA
jgi:transcription elongation factor GreA